MWRCGMKYAILETNQSYWSKPQFNNIMWFCGMDDLSSTMKGIEIDIDSEIKLKSSLGSRVTVGSWVSSKSLNSSSHSFSNNVMRLSKIGGSCSSSKG